jgi:hypothetical protein
VPWITSRWRGAVFEVADRRVGRPDLLEPVLPGTGSHGLHERLRERDRAPRVGVRVVRDPQVAAALRLAERLPEVDHAGLAAQQPLELLLACARACLERVLRAAVVVRVDRRLRGHEHRVQLAAAGHGGRVRQLEGLRDLQRRDRRIHVAGVELLVQEQPVVAADDHQVRPRAVVEHVELRLGAPADRAVA